MADCKSATLRRIVYCTVLLIGRPLELSNLKYSESRTGYWNRFFEEISSKTWSGTLLLLQYYSLPKNFRDPRHVNAPFTVDEQVPLHDMMCPVVRLL
jgi:hypothetical protein